MNNFIDAINQGTPLIAPAEDGLASLDIANGMLQSTWTKQGVQLPLDRANYQAILDSKMSQSNLRKKSNAEAKVDMNASYR